MKLKAKCKDGDLDLFFKVTEANKEKSLSSRYLHTTICITSILIPVIYMMKLKVKFKDGWHLPIFQGH